MTAAVSCHSSCHSGRQLQAQQEEESSWGSQLATAFMESVTLNVETVIHRLEEEEREKGAS